MKEETLTTILALVLVIYSIAMTVLYIQTRNAPEPKKYVEYRYADPHPTGLACEPLRRDIIEICGLPE